ncbi:MAG: thiol reductant ABC exporter subunit CydC [Vicinamibacterales bacterium]|nr:thiol reductant ABC exporter subunit CydC [Vicinamibacterales bacterium]
MTPLGTLARLLDEQRRRVLLSVLLLVATVGASVALMGTSAWLISTAALHPSIGVLQVAVVGVRVFGISRGVFRYLERLVSHDTTFRLLARLRLAVYRSLVPLVPSQVTFARSGDLLSRLVADVDTLEHALVRVAAPALAAAATIALVAVTLACFDPWVSMAATTALLAAATLAPWIGWRLGREAGEALVARRAELGAGLVDAVQGLPDLLAFGRARDHARVLDDTGRALERAQVQGARASALGGALVTLLSDAAAILVLALAVPLVRSGELAGVNLAVVALLTLAAFEAVAGLPAAAQGLAATRAAAARVFAFDAAGAMRVPGAPPAPGSAAGASAASTDGEAVLPVRVRGLSFTYPGSETPAVRDVSFDLSPGGVLAIVGPSGSGKSTIAHLLLRFWDPPPGTIEANGAEVLGLDADEWRAHVSFMGQGAHLFTGSVADNLLVARPGATAAQVAAAVRAAGLDECLGRLPDGERTWVGEQGAELSGGERQRLALARAILKPAPVLVLDEPTASVDPGTERAIARQVEALSRERAVLLITHRTAGLERAREILVLHDGVVVERGSYEALLSRGTWFPRMVALERDALAPDCNVGA